MARYVHISEEITVEAIKQQIDSAKGKWRNAIRHYCHKPYTDDFGTMDRDLYRRRANNEI